MVEDKTTIQISGHLRKRLKELSASRDIPYETLIEDFINIYDGLRFKNEREFAAWFEKNLMSFGFESIKKKNTHSCPDYILINNRGEEVRAELEFMSDNFIIHKHNPKDVDIIISVFTTKNEILDIPVLSLYYGYPYVWLNIGIDDYLMRRIKARAAMLDLRIKDYIARIAQLDIEKANTIIDKEKMMIPCPRCETLLIVNKNEDVADCPLCGQEIIVSEQKVIKYE